MISYTFITLHYEGNSLTGYVPPLDGGAIESGVTISGGLDLGQRNRGDLIDLPDHLIHKLSPYCGVTGEAAKELLAAKPLSISLSDSVIINTFSHKEATRLLMADWRRDSKIVFESLPDEIQTAIASVAFQYGDLPTRCPNFWRQVTTGDWVGAARNLNDFGDAYSTRRKSERVLVLWGMLKLPNAMQLNY